MVSDSISHFREASLSENRSFDRSANWRVKDSILSRELGPSRVSPNQRSRWKHAFWPLEHVNLRLCKAEIIRYSPLKFGQMHLCGMDYKYFSPHCCKCNSFGCTATIRCCNACHGPHSASLYSDSEHSQFNSPRLVKREAGFPNPRRALIGSNQLWRFNDSPYYQESWTDTNIIVPLLASNTDYMKYDAKTYMINKKMFYNSWWKKAGNQAWNILG